MPFGTIKWFNDDKGFGFITPDALGATDLFVHQSSFISERPVQMQPGIKVAYTSTSGRGGPRAVDVSVVS